MASAKCNDLVNRVSEAKNLANQAYQQLVRIRGLYQQTDDLQELNDLQDRRDSVRQLANDGAKLADALLQQAKQNGCGAEVEGQIEKELNYARSIFNQNSTLGGDIAFKIKRIEDRNKVLEKEKQAEADAKDTQKATTATNNAGTGDPGTAGTAPQSTNQLDQLTEVKVTGVKKPTAIDPKDPSLQNAGNINIAPPDSSILGGPKALDPNDPALQNVGNIDIGAPAIATQDLGGNPLGPGVLPPGSKLNPNTGQSVNSKTDEARGAAEDNRAFQYATDGDWRVRLSLAPGAKYLYRAATAGLLAPLAVTDGIIFPYTPSINVSYTANYDPTSLQHSNYKIFQYQNSAVENITIGCDFTAQDTNEANYILAVIHFLRTATKMFYGQDQDPSRGIPPPLCYLHGLGDFQFNGHPLVIGSFTYSLPTDVDYIMAKVDDVSVAEKGTGNTSSQRLGNQIAQGGTPIGSYLSSVTGKGMTYVPTKINIQFTANPVVARNDISNKFSLKEYATGKLLSGNRRPNKGGFW